MGFWDAGTHMSKQEWAGACRRVQNRLQNLMRAEPNTPDQKSKPGAATSKRDQKAPGSRSRLSGTKTR
jgi:hypothetical protein